MSNIISITTRRKVNSFDSPKYKAFIVSLDKMGLMDEMVNYQSERSRIGSLTIELILRGRILFKALTEIAETNELRNLTVSYLNHLECEYREYLKSV